MRSLVHWANGVYEDELLDMVSLKGEKLQSKVTIHGTICKLESGEMGSGVKGNQESFIMLTEGNWINITREQLRIP